VSTVYQLLENFCNGRYCRVCGGLITEDKKKRKWSAGSKDFFRGRARAIKVDKLAGFLRRKGWTADRVARLPMNAKNKICKVVGCNASSEDTWAAVVVDLRRDDDPTSFNF
jgi:hypothetical protein